MQARIASGARLEWLPLETICHDATRAENQLRFELAPGAEMIGWDILALGLPASRQAFAAGSMRQQIEIPGIWLDRALIDAGDRRLLDSPLGWHGRPVLGTLWFAWGKPIAPALRDQLLALSRACRSGIAAGELLRGQRGRGPSRRRACARAPGRTGDGLAGGHPCRLAQKRLATRTRCTADLAHLND